MSALDEELATLRSRLGSDPTRAATVRRRLSEVEAALGIAASSAEPTTAAADHSEVRKATRPTPSPRPAAVKGRNKK